MCRDGAAAAAMWDPDRGAAAQSDAMTGSADPCMHTQ